MNKTLWFSVGLVACNSKGSVLLDPEGNIIEDTGVVPDDTGEVNDTEETDESDDTDTQDTQDTEDTEETDTDPVELPDDNNNPDIYPNFWEGRRTLNLNGCSEVITEYGTEVSENFVNDWMPVCDCDEIYFIQVDRQSACGVAVQLEFYRAVKYNGFEVDILYYPNGAGSGPYTPSLLGTAEYIDDPSGAYHQGLIGPMAIKSKPLMDQVASMVRFVSLNRR